MRRSDDLLIFKLVEKNFDCFKHIEIINKTLAMA